MRTAAYEPSPAKNADRKAFIARLTFGQVRTFIMTFIGCQKEVEKLCGTMRLFEILSGFTGLWLGVQPPNKYDYLD